MMRRSSTFLIAAAFLATTVSCSSDSSSSGVEDAGPSPTDQGPTPTDNGPSPTDEGPTPTDEGPQPEPGEFGFVYRVPQSHTLACESRMPGAPDSLDQLESDWLCTFDYAGTKGHVYVQATPTGCEVMMGAVPVYGDVTAWISIDGAVDETSKAAYDHGGGHVNDAIDFTWGSKAYRYYHSSFGVGWRKCQPMDCLQVLDWSGASIEDGCTKERTLPVVCRPIKADGTHDELVDTFEPCDGDPNFP